MQRNIHISDVSRFVSTRGCTAVAREHHDRGTTPIGLTVSGLMSG